MSRRHGTRRRFLAATAGALSGSLSGCAGLVARSTGAPPAAVSLLAAGSLNNALENGLVPAVDADLRIEARGSTEAARLVAEGVKDPDVVSLADVVLFDSPLDVPWYAEFATDSLVLAYDPDSTGGRRIAAVPERWYRPILDGEASIGRTDPDADPLGYRTLFALELATAHYGTDVDLRAEIPARDQIYPETQLISQFETGSIDAAVAYRNMAVDRGYEYVEFPPEIDLSDPGHEDRYATASYELSGGRVVRGAPISYGSTVRSSIRDAVADVFDRHTTGDYLREFGFAVPEEYPRYTGDVPDEIAI